MACAQAVANVGPRRFLHRELAQPSRLLFLGTFVHSRVEQSVSEVSPRPKLRR
jgi:hypothetical protein